MDMQLVGVVPEVRVDLFVHLRARREREVWSKLCSEATQRENKAHAEGLWRASNTLRNSGTRVQCLTDGAYT